MNVHVAVELSDTLAVIVALQDVLKGTSKWDPFNEVASTNSGLLVHELEENARMRTTNCTGTLLNGVVPTEDMKSSTCSATA